MVLQILNIVKKHFQKYDQSTLNLHKYGDVVGLLISVAYFHLANLQKFDIALKAYYSRQTSPTLALLLFNSRYFAHTVDDSPIVPTWPWIDSFTPWTFSHHCCISLSFAFVQTSTGQRKLSIAFTKHFDVFPRARKSLKFLNDRPKINKISNESKCIIFFLRPKTILNTY